MAYSHLSFSPDDTRIIFTASDGSGSNVYDVPALGGAPRLLHAGVSGGRISPNRRALACVPNTGPGIVVSALAGGGVRTIATGLGDVSCLIWLPDSQSVLAYGRSHPALDAAYFSVRLGEGDIFLRDLRTGAERHVSEGPGDAKWYPAISPSGHFLACGGRLPGGARARRPIFIVSLADETWRKLGDDCGGRPREWVDDSRLVIERFARMNSIALIDTQTDSGVGTGGRAVWRLLVRRHADARLLCRHRPTRHA